MKKALATLMLMILFTQFGCLGLPAPQFGRNENVREGMLFFLPDEADDYHQQEIQGIICVPNRKGVFYEPGMIVVPDPEIDARHYTPFTRRCLDAGRIGFIVDRLNYYKYDNAKMPLFERIKKDIEISAIRMTEYYYFQKKETIIAAFGISCFPALKAAAGLENNEIKALLLVNPVMNPVLWTEDFDEDNRQLKQSYFPEDFRDFSKTEMRSYLGFDDIGENLNCHIMEIRFSENDMLSDETTDYFELMERQWKQKGLFYGKESVPGKIEKEFFHPEDPAGTAWPAIRDFLDKIAPTSKK